MENSEEQPSEATVNASSAQTQMVHTMEILENLPLASIADSSLQGYQPVDPNIVTVERITGWIVWSVLTVAGLLGLLYAWLSGMSASGLGIFVAVLLILSSLVAWSAHVIPTWEYKATGWRLDEKGFLVRTGVFWRQVITVPRARVQHADVHQGPLMRSYDLANLIVNTAGTENAKVELKGLNRRVAEQLRNALIEDREFNDAV